MELCKARSRILSALVAAVLMGLLVTACGDSDDGGSAGSGGGGEDLTIAFVNPLEGEPFFTAMECGAKAEAKKLGVKLESYGTAEYTIPKVTTALNAAGAKRPDGIITAVQDATAYNSTLATLQSNDIELVTMDGKPGDDKLYTAAITSDSIAGGRLAGRAMLDKVKAGDKVLVLTYAPSNKVQGARAEGLVKELEAAGVNVLPIQYTDNQTSKVTSIVTSTLAKHPDLAGVFVTNNPDLAPALTALNEQGAGDRVTVVAYDASPGQIDSLKQGKVYASVAQRPDIEGTLGLRYVVQALRGKDVPKETATDVTLVKADNLDEPETKAALYADKC
jgi:ribose transport system substrate-binding protein